MWSHAKEHFFNAGDIPSSNLHLPFLISSITFSVCIPVDSGVVMFENTLHYLTILSHSTNLTGLKKLTPSRREGIPSKKSFTPHHCHLLSASWPSKGHAPLFKSSAVKGPRRSHQRSRLTSLTLHQVSSCRDHWGRGQVTHMLMHRPYKSLIVVRYICWHYLSLSLMVFESFL